MSDDQAQEEEFVSTTGPVRIDWPRAAGYFGAVAAAVAFDVIAPPLAIFIAVMPFVKLLKREHATLPERFVAAVVEGAGKPVGGDAEGVVRPTWLDRKKSDESEDRGRPVAGSVDQDHLAPSAGAPS